MIHSANLHGIDKVFLKDNPDLVLVYGDTNATLVRVLAVSKLHVSIAHVEADIRSYNCSMPEKICPVCIE